MARKITIHIDGACSGKTLYGGWSVIVSDGEDKAVIHGGEPKTTNNRMELIALIEALSIVDALKAPVEIIGDSEYAIKSYKKYLDGWERSGWKKSDGKAVKNEDLWKKAAQIRKSIKNHPEIVQVAGHSGDAGNDEADDYAVKARLRAEESGFGFREKIRIRSGQDPQVVPEPSGKTPEPVTGQSLNARKPAQADVAAPAAPNKGGFLAFRILADRYCKSEISIEDFYAEVGRNASDIF